MPNYTDEPLSPPEPPGQEPDSTTQKVAPRPAPFLSPWGWALLALAALAVAGAWYLSLRHRPSDDDDPKKVELVIVQLNDTYRLDAVRDGKRGGLARVATLLRQLKAQHRNVIVFHAGDFISPSLESESFGGAQMIDALNFLHDIAPVYAVPGNHEFDTFNDKDPETLTAAINKSRFHWVASNLERGDPALLPALRERAAERFLLPFGKLKVGVFALTLDAAYGGPVRKYVPFAGDYAAVARREIARLDSAGADIIIGLTHLDMEDDRELAKLRREHPRFRWIAGGHEHYLQRDIGWPGSALVTKSESNARTVWKVSVVSRRGQAEVVEESVALDATVQPDAKFAHDVEGFYRRRLRQLKPYLDEVIAEQPDRCYDATEEVVRERESDWGSFLADQMRKAYRNDPAHVAVLHGGSIRIDDIFCNRFTFEHLERTFAFPTRLVYVKLYGKDLREHVLQSSVNSKRGDGRFLQVSGVRFRPETDGEGRVVLRDLKVESGKGWADLKDDKLYNVAVPEYLFQCKDGYRFRNYATEYIRPGPDLRALTYEALKAAGLKPASSKPANRQPAAAADTRRIITLPAYAAPFVRARGEWQKMEDADRQCP